MISIKDLDKFANSCLTDEVLDELIKSEKTLELLKVYLNIKHQRIAQNLTSKFDLHLSIVNDEDNDISLICECLKLYLYISSNSTNNSLEVLSHVLDKTRFSNRDEDYYLRILKILDEIFKFIKQQQLDILTEANINLINEFLYAMQKSHFQNIKTFINSNIMKYYIHIIPSKNILIFIKDMYQLGKDIQNFSALCNLYNFIDINVLKSDESILNIDDFWATLANFISSDNMYLQKQSKYLLLTSTHMIHRNSWNVPNKYIHVLEEDALKTWNIFFTILDISQEKQLHLVEPALKLLKYVKNLHFDWQMCVFKLLLNHSQLSVIYKTVSEILKIIKPDNFNALCKIVLPAINKNEFSTQSNIVIYELCKFVNNLNWEQISLFVEDILKVSWNPTTLWCLVNNMTKFLWFSQISLEQIEILLNIINNLPHIYIREGCKKKLINHLHNSYKLSDFENLIKVCNILVEEINSNDFIQFVLNHYKDKYQNNILEIIKVNNEVFAKHFTVCLSIIKIVNNIDCIEYLNNNVQSYPLSLTVFIFKYFDDVFTIDEFINKQFVKYFDKDEVIPTDKLLPILLKLKYDNVLYVKCQQVLLNAELYDSDKLYLAFKFLTCQNSKINSEIIHIWVNKFLQSEKVDSKTSLGFVDLYFSKRFVIRENVDTHIKILEIILDTQTEDVVVYLFQKFQILSEVADYKSLLNLFDLYFNQVKKLKGNMIKQAVSHFINTLLTILIQNEGNEIILKGVMEKSSRLLEIAQTYDIIYYYFATSLLKLKSFDVYVTFIPMLLEIILQGVIIHKDTRTEYNVCQEIFLTISNIESMCPNWYKLSARVCALKLIYRMCKNPKNGDIVATHLFKIYERISNKRYFPDSLIHLQKLRIFQLLLILAPNIRHQKSELINLIIESFCTEIHQPDIKQLMQWILILLIKDDAKQYIAIINAKINSTIKTQPSTIAALIPVIMHIGLFDPKQNLESVVEILLPYCMGANFKLRVYSQVAICLLYERTKNKNDFLKIALDKVISASGNSVSECLGADTYFFELLDPITHYSMRNIMVDIPRHNKVTNTEWENLLNPTHLEFLNIIEGKSLFCETHFKQITDDPKSLLPDDFTLNIQKKITPWRDEIISETSNRKNEFILIATLLEKPTNLGGLSRTCEVFGVSKLILNDNKVLNDKEFKSLSMSSENWTKTLEVKANDLCEFMANLKSQGYTIIGAEQTAESVMLDQFQFPRKSVLLLGNEKEGIPANLIPLLDVCVEIPQLGMVRSLNVHVAGATFIWEYTKQHLV